MTRFPATRLLGVRVDMPAFDQVVRWATRRVEAGEGGYVCHVNAHGLVDAQTDLELARSFDGADLAVPDGMPLVWLGRLRGLAAQRVYGPDFMRALLADGGPACRHFLFGSTPEVLAALEARVAADHPGATVVGRLSPPFGPGLAEAMEAHVEAIRASRANVVWVGLGAPRQEKWMAQVAGRLPGVLLFGVGAAFDFLAGTKPQAPAPVRAAGLEWAFRWLSEPRRLTARYGRIIPAFLWLVLRDAVRGQDRAV